MRQPPHHRSPHPRLHRQGEQSPHRADPRALPLPHPGHLHRPQRLAVPAAAEPGRAGVRRGALVPALRADAAADLAGGGARGAAARGARHGGGLPDGAVRPDGGDDAVRGHGAVERGAGEETSCHEVGRACLEYGRRGGGEGGGAGAAAAAGGRRGRPARDAVRVRGTDGAAAAQHAHDARPAQEDGGDADQRGEGRTRGVQHPGPGQRAAGRVDAGSDDSGGGGDLLMCR